MVVLLALLVGREWVSALAFDPVKLQRVGVGMAHRDVRRLLGPPDRTLTDRGRLTWRYDDVHFLLRRARHYVRFKEGRVSSVVTDTW